ncbi:M56 family metallopeptidase [Flavobacterium foetidum]|uniref:M56 family metallopeptidase n=1 Tax=Flavobacterium foetidum TaxID=2026681 RepID=UPI001074BCB2|nr:M56 family metallopeptidase [Flavobacterium foetidum]KAF2513943.1 peptidase M56 [Flavobacterium foetidum]
MEALFIFILKSSGLLATFYFAYVLLLRKETFFNSSRWFLLAGLLTSVILPFVVYTKVVWVDPAPAPDVMTQNVSMPEKNTNLAVDAVEYRNVSAPQQIATQESFEINWNWVYLSIYCLGFIAFMIKFALDFYSLNSVLKNREIKQQEDFKFVDVTENIAPFSYFDYIVYNSSLYTANELQNILEHEKVHSDQKHTIDVLFSRIFCILFWFNPIMWLYKKAILQNLEFIADSEATKKISDKKAYQYTMLKITTHDTCVAITNHFYQSLIKKRIVMLNKNQSKKTNYWKYYAVIPALGAFVLLFQIETIAQERKLKNGTETVIEKDTVKETKELITITKKTSDKQLQDLKEKLKANHNLELKVSDVKRNADEELTSIQLQVNPENGKKQIVSMNSNKAIKDFTLVIGTDTNGSKNISIDGLKPPTPPNAPTAVNSERVVVRTYSDSDITPPVAPVAPVFPQGPMPKAPVVDMSKMPKAPLAPSNPNDKAAMKKFETDMAEFEKKMASFEPDMRAFEKEMEEVMSKRTAIFEKEMAKYEIAMEKYAAEMEKYQGEMNQTFSYNFNMNFDEKEARIQADEMKKQAEIMKQHAKEMRKHAEEMRKQERKYNSKS